MGPRDANEAEGRCERYVSSGGYVSSKIIPHPSRMVLHCAYRENISYEVDHLQDGIDR